MSILNELLFIFKNVNLI